MDSYNSKFPLEYYEIGEAYQFYGKSFNSLKKATDEQIIKYRSFFDIEGKRDDTLNYFSNDNPDQGKKSGLQRYVGIVVEKVRDKNSKIRVLFLNVNNGKKEYLINTYTVGRSSGVNTDGFEGMTANFSTNRSTNGYSTYNGKTSGVTKSSGTNTPSGITKSNGERNNGTGTSGITSTTGNNKKASGITAVKRNSKASGITAVKNSKSSGITKA